MKNLFSIAGVESHSKNQAFTKDKMRSLVLAMRDREPEDVEFERMYNKYKKHIMFRASDIRGKDSEYITNVLMAGAYALKKDMPKFVNQTTLDNSDIDSFLNFNLQELYIPKEKSFRKLRNGMKFVDSFTRKYYTNVKEGAKATEDSLINMFEVACISLHIAPPKTRMTTTRLFSTYTHASKGAAKQFAQNFNMLIATYLFSYYGLKSMKARGDTTLYLHSSSEGWLGRMVASFKVAINNPNIKVVYKSLDPNIAVVEAFEDCKKYLLKKYRIKNWDATIYNQGSEEDNICKLDSKETFIDCSFTSPPYLDLENYPDTEIISLSTGQELRISHLETILIENRGLISAKDIRVGDTIAKDYKGVKSKGVKVARLSKTNQCASMYKTPRRFDELFLRPTVKNIYDSNYKGGYLILNVVNNGKHKTMEKSTTDICREQGYTLKETLKLGLTRKPGKAGDIRLADAKKPYEPIFIFQK